MADVEEKHPDYTTESINEWALMRATKKGESEIKRKAELYLPKPSGFTMASDGGTAMYNAYRKRAQFEEIVSPTISSLIGLAHNKETEIELPESMNYIIEKANKKGLTLNAFHQSITRNLLTTGRYCILTDAPVDGGEPILCGFIGETLINWDEGSEFYVIDDSGPVRNGFKWTDQKRHIVLELVEGKYVQKIYIDGVEAVEQIEPTALGNKAMDRIPFAVANALDMTPDIQTPPLIGVAQAALANYQLSADYRHQLFMSGQETLVAINGKGPTAVGAGVIHEMQGAEGIDPDLKYVSPTCSGIEAHKEAMQANRSTAATAGARLLEQQDGNKQESGEARGLRFTSETASLQSIVNVSAQILERSLRDVALMKGLNEDDVSVTPPKDLMDQTLNPQDAKALVEVWQAGGVSHQTLDENLQRGGIRSKERTFEEEIVLINSVDDADEDDDLQAAA